MNNQTDHAYKPRRFYFDWAATAVPSTVDDGVFIDKGGVFGTPSSRHLEGRAAQASLEEARSRCAAVLGVLPETLYFTSGGTESNALVLFSLLLRPQKVKLLYSAVEHPSVRENCLALERFGISLAQIRVEQDGRVSRETLAAALEKHPDARFVSIMAVNNETGSFMDMQSLSPLIRSRAGAPIHFHSDLVQAAGKIPLDIKGWDIDSASISAHKIGGPMGTGLLYLKKPVQTLYSGGGQEGKIRPGTENLAGALHMAKSLEKYARPGAQEAFFNEASSRMKFLISGLKKNKRSILIPETREEGDPRFSPWILQARFKGVPGEVMVRALDSEGFAVSTGSACSSSSQERPVLSALGLDNTARLEGIRISQGWSTSLSDIEALLEAIEKVLGIL
ncbi:MAG: aminotransferase class V-fold PLP-dependent enzyme [Treponema sp.]|jgi:cysteine desulfurase|nr:aminotransferase class V-fold PLP-dependent enzyme [Treponema sp.]